MRRLSGSVCATGLLTLAFASPIQAQGGCGSVCIPLDAIDPEMTMVPEDRFRILVTGEYTEFDNFRVGDDDVSNPGGNRAIISTTTVFFEYGVTPRLTAAVSVPYVNKSQTTNRFDERVAEGLGDAVLFGRYEVVSPQAGVGPSLALGLGVKFPTGSNEEPGGATSRLPPAFQAGSDAFDLVPTASYFQRFSGYSLFGSTFLRIPLEANDLGYRFGREWEFHFGTIVPLPFWKGRLQALASVDILDAEQDEDNEGILPGRVRDGSTVLNTGGRFVDLTPGLRITLSQALSLHARFFIPVFEDWNGRAASNVGQVAPDLTTQLTLTYSFQ